MMQGCLTAWHHVQNFHVDRKFSLVIWNSIFGDAWTALAAEQ
jgi:hypothetical protein